MVVDHLDQSRTVYARQCPFHSHSIPPEPKMHAPPELAIKGNTHVVSQGSIDLLAEIGGGDKIREFITRFYSRAFLDFTLKPFFYEEDGAEAHAKRLADWVIEKMGGEGRPWYESGRWGQRQSSHVKAWNSKKRDKGVRGSHFSLDDTRVWMRLHFWAARECGLADQPSFFPWYIQFIEHFISVYERRAPPYTAESAQWSADPKNIALYVAQGHKMEDVIGIGRYHQDDFR
eukprot:CAMPEP_0198231636 /NCGR_PEP_ID=MMETSP1445-20131203/115307_1 /TAXON_ID=36898 /ORGANISM="Pyramimonas sp., Strain CCMP2087" /LENGTH=230 /DNA_ID=CAMNT_0043912261 /DNA_START=472 /DNA_END=1164 /DNA_ORIENTATION=+